MKARKISKNLLLTMAIWTFIQIQCSCIGMCRDTYSCLLFTNVVNVGILNTKWGSFGKNFLKFGYHIYHLNVKVYDITKAMSIRGK